MVINCVNRAAELCCLVDGGGVTCQCCLQVHLWEASDGEVDSEHDGEWSGLLPA